MAEINSNFFELAGSYLFKTIADKKARFLESKPELTLLNLGIGDATLPLPKVALDAMRSACTELETDPIGYGPSGGHAFLRSAISKQVYASLFSKEDPVEKVRAQINEADFAAEDSIVYIPDENEIFVSEGAKSDTALLSHLFSNTTRICVTDPVYPVYVDSSALFGKIQKAPSDSLDPYTNVVYARSTDENAYCPLPPSEPCDLIYLCSPHNPTGSALSRQALKAWVEYAKRHQAIIIYDAAYSAFIEDPEIPKSIYEIPGASSIAIECGSFSKCASFTGVRCAWCVIPKKLRLGDSSLNTLWSQFKNVTYNGLSYPVQRAAEALLTDKGLEQMRSISSHYMRRAQMLYEGLHNTPFKPALKPKAPYIWCKVPKDMTSWQAFDELLNSYAIVTTPGSGFGPSGEGYVRFSAFANDAAIESALERLTKGAFV
jgi:LL-diaminopimelate aminotransferase